MISDIPDSAIERLSETMWLLGSSNDASHTDARNDLEIAVKLINSVGGKVTWEDSDNE